MADEEPKRRAQEMMKLIEEEEEKLYGKCECGDVQAGICDACARKEARRKSGFALRIW